MFNKSNFCHIASNNRNEQKGSVFIYKTTDTLAQVTQSGYFNEKLIDINVHDLIIHVQYDPVARTLKKSVLIVTERTMDNVETTPILDQTIGDDIADLGDQVAGIEEKIPSDASAQNQLATQNDITNKITNCITEIPQDIKLELANGVLTLKAGSTYYTPNGADTYTKTTTTADKTLTNTNNNQWIVFVNQGGNLQVWGINSLYSGTTAPSGVSYPMWWDTTNNIIKISNDSGATWRQQFSLPLCIITVSNGAISSIDQVFNGFGYMGSTEFVLPDMEGLSSYGFNDDGTYKNLPMRTSKVNTLTVSGNTSIKVAITTDGYPVWYSASAVRYDKESNRVLYTGTPRNAIIAGEFDVVDGRIQNFKPYKTFRAVDYSDFENTVEELDNSVVHNTDNETIDGVKTFNNTIRIKGSAVTFEGISNSSAQSFKDVDAYDDTGTAVGTIRIERSTTNGQSVNLISRKSDGSVGANLVVRTSPDGTYSLFTSVTPASTANGGEIATTGWANAKFLPLAGGTMSGAITRSGTQLAKRNVDNSYLELDGGTTYLNGAYLRLDGKDSSGTPGQFRLATGDGSANKQLIGKPDGTLNWNGEPVTTTKAKSLAQNGYVKFNNGLIVQWGELAADSSGRYTVNFPTAFTSTNYTITAIGVSAGKITTYAYVQYGDKTTTYVQLATTADATHNGVRWMAIGY